MRNILIGLVLVVIILAGAFYYFNKPSAETELQSPLSSEQTIATPIALSMESPSPVATAGIKEFSVMASNFKFSMDEIRVKKGDTVRIIFKNEIGMHDWKIDEFSVATKVLQTGQEETIEFVADKAGEFEYYCSVGNHRAMGMKGMLIVE